MGKITMHGPDGQRDVQDATGGWLPPTLAMALQAWLS